MFTHLSAANYSFVIYYYSKRCKLMSTKSAVPFCAMIFLFFFSFLSVSQTVKRDACNEKVLGSIPRSCMNQTKSLPWMQLKFDIYTTVSSHAWQWFHKCSSFLIGVLWTGILCLMKLSEVGISDLEKLWPSSSCVFRFLGHADLVCAQSGLCLHGSERKSLILFSS